MRQQLLPLWRASLRAIDDIKDSVREAGALGFSDATAVFARVPSRRALPGLLLLKALGKLTLRLSDPTLHHTTPTEGRDIVAQMMAFLLSEGVTHPVKDAQVGAACIEDRVVRVIRHLLLHN